MNGFIIGLITLGVIAVVVLVIVSAVVNKIKSTLDVAAPLLNAIAHTDFDQQEYEIENTPKSVNAMTSIYLPRIEADFPEFNYFEFKKKAENMLISAFDAISDENPEGIINASSDLKSQVSARIDANRTALQKEVFRDVVIHQTEIKNYVKNSGTCKITLQSSVGYHHYIKTNGGDVKSGSETAMKQTRYDTDLLYVQDVSKVQKGETAIGMNCPNCGAPIKTLGEKTCPYCGSGITEINVLTWSINSFNEV